MTIRSLRNIFLTGLAVVLPIVVTAWLLWWIGVTFEKSLGNVYKFLISERLYFPGLGILLGLGLVFLVGLLAKAWLFRSLFDWWDGLLNRIPLVKTIYGATQDFMRFLSGGEESKFDRVVLVEVGAPSMKLMGFVTREDFSQFPGLADDNEVAVFFPMSYQIGGYTLFLPRSRLQPLEMRSDEAMRLILTAGLSVSSRDGSSGQETRSN